MRPGRARLCAALLLAAMLVPGGAGRAEEGNPGESADAAREPDPGGAGDAVRPYGDTPEELLPYRSAVQPYRRLYVTPPAFRGPGRDKPAPEGLQAVRIGLVAPLQGTEDSELGRNLQRGVGMAFEEANAAGGYQGLPFELVSKNDQALWGASSNTLVELAWVDKVWALIGSIDSNSTHVALRAALKAEVLIVNVGSTDPTMTETGIPWIVRVTPDDRQTSYRIAQWLFAEQRFSRVAVLRSSDRYGRFGVLEFRDAAKRLQRPLPMEILIRPGSTDISAQLERIAAAKPEAIVVWAKAEDAGRFVREIRARGLSQPIVGTDRLASREFFAAARDAAEGVVATLWMNTEAPDQPWRGFRERYRARYDAEPDAFAAYGYDAATLVIEAVRRQGLNRARIRDAMMGIRSYQGVAGPMRFDTTSNNVARPFLARAQGGRFVVQ